jgi:hypothetical protein
MSKLNCRSKAISLAFGAADTIKSQVIAEEGLLKHLYLAVPNFTNSVTAVVTLETANGLVLYTSAAQSKNAVYNLENQNAWLDQLIVGGGYVFKVTLSGVPGGSGGTVTGLARLYGAKW